MLQSLAPLFPTVSTVTCPLCGDYLSLCGHTVHEIRQSIELTEDLPSFNELGLEA